MSSSDSRMDEIVSAYIGLIDLYGDIVDTNEDSYDDYSELTITATRILINSLSKTSFQEKMDFCLKASAWLGIQQLCFLNTRVQEFTQCSPDGIDSIRSSFIRSM